MSILSLDNQCTSVCCKSVTWSLAISLHNAENMQYKMWRRKQLLARAFQLHYVSLSWLLRHQYRYQHILTTKVNLMSQSCPVLKKYPLLLSWFPVVCRRGCLPYLTPHKRNGHIPGTVPGLLTQPAVTHRIHWLVCEAVIVSKYILPCH